MSTDTPAQWRMVPMEATQEMCAAAVRFANGSAVYKNVAAEALKIEESIYAEVYEAMLAASPEPTAAQPLTDEQIDAVALHAVYDDDDTCAYRDAWCREVGRPFARAIERAHGIGASAAPAQAAPNYAGPKDCPDEAWELALKVRADLDRISCPGVYMDKAVDAICKRWSAAPVAELVEALRKAEGVLEEAQTYTSSPSWSPSMTEECAAALATVRAALSRAPGAGMLNA